MLHANRLKVIATDSSSTAGSGAALSTGVVGLNQQEQAQIIGMFHKGDINVLVATCIAEEGLGKWVCEQVYH